MVRGYALPGMPNLHSHAFQRAMAGLAEHAGAGGDSFWTWREAMYRLADRLEPEDVQAIAAQLYVEMLEAGYTAVGEFHYLHHGRDGRPYERRSELGARVAEAATTTGIDLTLLPVLYAARGFDGGLPEVAQRRFTNDVDGLLIIVEQLRRLSHVRVGVAPHSLRAVPPADLTACIQGIGDASAPIHIHVAEQVKEVDDCISARGARPIEWLLDNAPVDPRWCLVHGTHGTHEEMVRVARVGAVVGLCPTTEANLGDGVPHIAELLAEGGRFGIGSDSHISVSVVEELRWLEYLQRLTHWRRNALASQSQPSTATRLYTEALAGGAQALGQPIGALTPGLRASIVVLDPDHPALAERPIESVLDAWVFAASRSAVSRVMVAGRWLVENGRHVQREAVLARYRDTLRRLGE
jgi:formimidoylglutamate deiminase